MVKSRTKYIGTGATVTLVGLLVWFALSYHFEFELDGDIVCAGTYEDPCEAHYNITLVNPIIKTYYIQNKDRFSLDFVPDVKASYNCKKDGRYKSKARLDREKYPCGVGWREFDWKTPLTPKYKYIEKFERRNKKEYKIVVFKNDPEDKIKWGGRILKEEVDPIFYGQYNITKICDYRNVITKKKKYHTEVFFNNYTCPTNNYKVNKSTKVGYCYEENPIWNSTNQTWTDKLIFSHYYDKIIPPKTIQRITKNKTKYIDYINTTVCDLQGYQINQFKVNFSLCNMFCGRDGKIVSCDSTIDGNGDDILQSGESGFSFDITKVNWKNFKKKVDSVKYTKLRDCIVKT